MATITSTIKLVDQMTPTLNKISKAIDRVSQRSDNIGTSIERANNRALASAHRYGNTMVKYTDQINFKQNQFNSTLNKTKSLANSVASTFRRILTTLGLVLGVRQLVSTVDSMMNSTARLYNLTGDLATAQYYLDAIYSSAQRSGGSFINMANSVAKLGTVAGDAFNSVEEMIAFTELMNKLFVLSGASATESANAMYQLTQAMAAGRLQGDEMRSILENAPLLAQKLADYLGVSVGELKDLGAKGLITADIIKAALFGAADEIDERFEAMPKTFGRIWNEICNHALNAFRPVIDRVQQFINSPTFEKFKNRLLSIIDKIANGIIRIFDILETPRFQNALSKIGTAFGALWEVVCWVGNAMVNIARWICDNWNWISTIVYTVVWAFLIYKAAVVIATAATWAYNAAQFAAGLIAGTVVLTTFGWVMLIIVAIIAVLYLAVAAWNHFTGQTVSATGIIFGAVAFVIACVIDLFVFLWDICVSVVHIMIALGKTILQIFCDVLELIGALLIDFVMGVGLSVVTILHVIVSIGRAIWDTFIWIFQCLGVAVSNLVNGLGQCLTIIGAYWDKAKAGAAIFFWGMVSEFGAAINRMIQGAGEGVKQLLTPFVDFANTCIDIFNSIAEAWNNSLGSWSTTITNPFTGTQYEVGFGKISTKASISVDDVLNIGTTIGDLSGGKLMGAMSDFAAAQAIINAGVNWGVNDLPEYTADWKSVWGNIGEMWSSADWKNPLDAFDADKYGSIWGDLTGSLDKTWDSSQYTNPIEAFKNWYDKGAKLEDGVGGIIDGIGALLGGLFGKQDSPMEDIVNDVYKNSTLEDLLSGTQSPDGAGSGINDALGAIADNTGSTAGSTGNIEDTLDLAEEELELLRKLAEQEVINRFTTAEIQVDMTNNNNINSKMDLDGIVTHLSNKLYEELGVVASGVHY